MTSAAPRRIRPAKRPTAADSLGTLLTKAAESGPPDRASLWLRALADGEPGAGSTAPTSPPETKGTRRPQKGVSVNKRVRN